MVIMVLSNQYLSVTMVGFITGQVHLRLHTFTRQTISQKRKKDRYLKRVDFVPFLIVVMEKTRVLRINVQLPRTGTELLRTRSKRMCVIYSKIEKSVNSATMHCCLEKKEGNVLLWQKERKRLGGLQVSIIQSHTR